MADSNDGLGLTDPRKKWRNSKTMATESFIISCKVNTKISFENPLTQQHKLSTQESTDHPVIHKNLLERLIVDHLSESNSNIDQQNQPLAQPINSFPQSISQMPQQMFQPLTQTGLKFDKVLSSSLKIDKSNSTVSIEEIKITSCDVFKLSCL